MPRVEKKKPLESKKRKPQAPKEPEPLLEDGVSKKTAARRREAVAQAEICRLRLELANLRAEGCPGFTAQQRKRDESLPILPKRALSLAGYWNVLANDILTITPALVAAMETNGASILRREGKHLCFYGKDRLLVIQVVMELMPQLLPHYQRRDD